MERGLPISSTGASNIVSRLERTLVATYTVIVFSRASIVTLSSAIPSICIISRPPSPSGVSPSVPSPPVTSPPVVSPSFNAMFKSISPSSSLPRITPEAIYSLIAKYS